MSSSPSLSPCAFRGGGTWPGAESDTALLPVPVLCLNLVFLGITIARPVNEELVALLLLPLLLLPLLLLVPLAMLPFFPLVLLAVFEGLQLLLCWLLSAAVLCICEEAEALPEASCNRAFFGMGDCDDDDNEGDAFFGMPEVCSEEEVLVLAALRGGFGDGPSGSAASGDDRFNFNVSRGRLLSPPPPLLVLIWLLLEGPVLKLLLALLLLLLLLWVRWKFRTGSGGFPA